MYSRTRLLLFLASQSALLVAQSSGFFSWAGQMQEARDQHTATLLRDGQVLIAGGRGAAHGQVLATVELYDPATRAFRPSGRLIFPRAGHAATLLANGQVLITGGDVEPSFGVNNPNTLTNTAELYDPSTGTSVLTGSMTTPRKGHAGTRLNNGKVLITGSGSSQYTVPAAELFDPDSGSFTQTGPYAAAVGPTCNCSPASLLPDGNVWVGGILPAQIYDARMGVFFATSGSNELSTSAALKDGRVFMAGGERFMKYFDGDHWLKLGLAELYSPELDSFEQSRGMGRGRAHHTMNLLADGTVLVTGGEADWCWSGGCESTGPENSAEVYDPVARRFTGTDSMRTPRQFHAATLLNDGSVLVTGGQAKSGTLFELAASAEVYTPNTPAPVLELLSLGGGQAAALHAGTSTIVSAGNPAAWGDFIEIYWTGRAEGAAFPPQVTIGGRMAEVVYFGQAPGYENLSQVNVRVPAGVAPGGNVSVSLAYLGRMSNPVTIGVRDERP